MVWRETCTMEERMRFVDAVVENTETFAAVCRRFGVSRKTGYTWLARYQAEGVEGLKDQSRAPLHHVQALTARIADLCLAVRRAHPTWGPVKVKAWLEKHRPQIDWPAASTIGALFDREGLTVKRVVPQPAIERAVWAMHGGQRHMVHGLQRLVRYRRRQALRADDAERCPQSLSAAVSGAGAQ